MDVDLIHILTVALLVIIVITVIMGQCHAVDACKWLNAHGSAGGDGYPCLLGFPPQPMSSSTSGYSRFWRPLIMVCSARQARQRTRLLWARWPVLVDPICENFQLRATKLEFCTLTGTAEEMVCPGGEAAFVGAMVADSLQLQDRIHWCA